MHSKLLSATLISLILLSNLVLAIPGVPNAFYGQVTVNGNPAPDGTVVVAKIDGAEVSSTTTSGGTYGYPIGSFYVDDPDHDRSGKEVSFFVNGVDSGKTEHFVNGHVDELDMSVTIQGGGSPPPSGGGGGGSGGGSSVQPCELNGVCDPWEDHETCPSDCPEETTTTTTIEEQPSEEQPSTEEPVECEERWVCNDWSRCIDGLQIRTCVDVNECGTDMNKPLVSQPCSALESEETSVLGFLTGLAAVLAGSSTYIIIVMVVLGAVVIFVVMKYGLKSKPPQPVSKEADENDSFIEELTEGDSFTENVDKHDV